MSEDVNHAITWERRQAELWDRVFQASQDIVTLVDSLEGGPGMTVLQQSLAKTALAIGPEVVRAHAADDEATFYTHLKEARLKAIETDYWLRMAYLLQQREEIQRDFSSVITQYAAIVDLLQKFIRHTQAEKDGLAHRRASKVNLG